MRERTQITRRTKITSMNEFLFTKKSSGSKENRTKILTKTSYCYLLHRDFCVFHSVVKRDPSSEKTTKDKVAQKQR